MHFERGTATPTSTHTATQLCPLPNTWACEYANFSLVSWFRPTWGASVHPPSPSRFLHSFCFSYSSSSSSISFFYSGRDDCAIFKSNRRPIMAQVEPQECWNYNANSTSEEGGREGGSWTICSLKQTCAKKARGLNLTHFICKYRKYNITHGTRTRPQRASRESQCQSGQRCWVPGAGDRLRFAGKLVSPQRPVNYHNTQGARCLPRTGQGQGRGQGQGQGEDCFEPGHNNRL